jgi:hypothetical protein
MEEGTHHEPNENETEINLSLYKPQNMKINNYNKIFKFRRRQDKRVTINTHTDDIRHNLNKLTKFVDINVPAVMGETLPTPTTADILQTLTSGMNKFLPDTVETEMNIKKSKYDDAFDWFVYKYLEQMQLN